MKHTPGPWKVIDGWDKNGNGKYFPSVVLSDSKKFKHFEHFDHGAKVIVNESHDSERESIMANAYLIAAAPDLLEALEGLTQYLAFMFKDPKFREYTKAIAAINKAKGL